MKKISWILLFLLPSIFLHAQQTDSMARCGLRISLLTCTPGTELYSTFGHSAMRVVDSARGTDLIFNYGTFNFDDPHFYSKFVRGKLQYFVSVDEFGNFLEEYKSEGRGITEQVLHLNCDQQHSLLQSLEKNAREENKYYKYDFVYDNCTTRLRDQVIPATSSFFTTKNILPYPGVTFRNLIHEYLDRGHQEWNALGIDMLLGSPVDKKISNSEAMFLPDYLLKGFDSTRAGNEKLVGEKKIILPAGLAPVAASWFTPFNFFLALFLLVLLLSIFASRRLRLFFDIFDFLLFFMTSAIGMLILFMWIGTDHQACRNNYNLVWALPTHLLVIFFMFRKKMWVRKYFRAVALLQFLLLIFWKGLPQQFNIALIPIVALIMTRSYVRCKIPFIWMKKNRSVQARAK